MNPAPDVCRLLRSARRRWLAQRFAQRVAVALLAAGAVLVAAVAGERWWGLASLRMETMIALGGLMVLLPAIATWLSAPDLPGLARLLDRRGQTHDRLATALAFSGQEGSPIRALALQECRAFLQGKDFRALLPWRWPSGLRWLVVPAIALALLQWDLRVGRAHRADLLAQAQEESAPTVEALRALAKEIQAEAKKTDDPELRKLAEELARRAESLRAAADPAAAEKAALRELSALEQMAQEIQRAGKAPSPEELQALAAALEKAEATRAAAEKMQRGEMSAAAEELERAAQSGEGSTGERAEAALRQALQRLAEQQQLSQEMQQQLSPAPGSAADSALRRLAEMLRKMPPSQGGKPGQQKPAPASPEALKNLLAALQNMKAGAAPPGGKQGGQAGAPQVLQIGPPNAKSGGAESQLSFPGGRPGSELDPGTTESPLGKERQESANKGGEMAVQGQQTEKGELESQMLPGGADVSRANRRYKQMYEVLAPAAESAVLQEEIPLGSRLFIKRYFEAIRPVE